MSQWFLSQVVQSDWRLWGVNIKRHLYWRSNLFYTPQLAQIMDRASTCRRDSYLLQGPVAFNDLNCSVKSASSSNQTTQSKPCVRCYRNRTSANVDEKEPLSSPMRKTCRNTSYFISTSPSVMAANKPLSTFPKRNTLSSFSTRSSFANNAYAICWIFISNNGLSIFSAQSSYQSSSNSCRQHQRQRPLSTAATMLQPAHWEEQQPAFPRSSTSVVVFSQNTEISQPSQNAPPAAKN